MSKSAFMPSGVPKRAAGRPSLTEDPADTVRLNVFLTKDQREKFRRLGGSAWLRERIERAREPESE